MKDIIDNPNDPYYGPARRLSIILAGITADIADLDRAYFREWGNTPYQELVMFLKGGAAESPAMREIIGRVFVAIDNY